MFILELCRSSDCYNAMPCLQFGYAPCSLKKTPYVFAGSAEEAGAVISVAIHLGTYAVLRPGVRMRDTGKNLTIQVDRSAVSDEFEALPATGNILMSEAPSLRVVQENAWRGEGSRA